MRLVLLPGMDGTGDLYGPLLAALPSDWHARVVAYPLTTARYADLEPIVGALAPDDVVIAESFSGPLAIRIARTQPIRALVLIASFLRGPWITRALPLDALLAIRPPRIAIRMVMVGLDAPSEVVDLVRDTITRVPSRTIAARVREAALVDAREDFAALRTRVIWLRAARDRMVAASATTEARHVRPDLDVRVLDGPHLLAQVRPTAVIAALRTSLPDG